VSQVLLWEFKQGRQIKAARLSQLVIEQDNQIKVKMRLRSVLQPEKPINQQIA